MPLKHSSNIKQQKAKLKRFLENDAPRIVGVEAKKHIASNFKQQGFVDLPFKKWVDRKRNERTRRAILVKTGRLKNSFNYRTSKGRVTVFSGDIPYAKIHNEGGKIKGTQKVRGHYRTNKRSREKYKVKSFSREMDVTIPKRQFMGNSRVLTSRINRRLLRRASKIMN